MVRCDGSHSIHDAVGHVHGDMYVTLWSRVLDIQASFCSSGTLAATIHCMYIEGSVVVPAMRKNLDSGSAMLALRRGVGQ